jgi:hypothetical protein
MPRHRFAWPPPRPPRALGWVPWLLAGALAGLAPAAALLALLGLTVRLWWPADPARPAP